MKRLSFILIAAAAISICLPSYGDTPEPARKKVGLVLSGGGAKGVAHIGVIKVLEEAGIPIDFIAGTSMGAIVGGLYAIGYTTGELDSLVRSQDWGNLLSDYVRRDDKLLYEKEAGDMYILSLGVSLDRKLSLPSGVVSGQNVLNLLNEMTIGYHDEDVCFDSLPIPFACVAYDMVQGEELVFRRGNLPLAIRSSMSIPGAFEPVILDSMVLVDGGIYNNFPVDVVREMGAELVIGVDVSGKTHGMEGLGSIMGIIDQITTLMGREKYRKNVNDVDLHIHPEIEPYTSASFNPTAIDSLLIRGEREATRRWDDIMVFKEKICITEPCETRTACMRFADTDILRIGSIHFLGLTANEEALIRPSLRIAENTTITKGELNNAIGRLRGSGAFSYVTYTLSSKPPYDLIISVNEQHEASVNIGFRFDTEEMASILLNTTLNLRGLQGPRLGVTVRLNDNPFIKLDFNSSRWFLGRLGASYMFRSNNYNLYSNGKRLTSVSFGHNRVDLFYLVANPHRFTVNAGVRYEHFNYDSFLYSPDWLESSRGIIAVEPEGFLNYYISTQFETRDSRYFPTRGMNFSTMLTLHTDNGINYKGGSPFASILYTSTHAVRLADRTTLIPSINGRTIIGNNTSYAYFNYMGGNMAGRYMDQQLPFVGIKHIESFSHSLLSGILELRQRIGRRHYVSAIGGYAIHNNNFFQMFSDRNDIWGVGLKYSYDSVVGPITLLVERANTDRPIKVYFSLGKVF